MTNITLLVKIVDQISNRITYIVLEVGLVMKVEEALCVLVAVYNVTTVSMPNSNTFQTELTENNKIHTKSFDDDVRKLFESFVQKGWLASAQAGLLA